MTTGAQSVRRAAPANLKEWGIVFRMAGMTVVRLIAAMITVVILARVRGNASIEFQLGAVAVSIGCLYIALGAGARVWVFYIVLFTLFAQLRAHADEVGTPVQYSYAFDAEKVLFFGSLPMIWLQDAFYKYARLGPLELYSIVVYLSYFFVPHAVALAMWRWDRKRFRIYLPAFLITLYVGLTVCAIAPTAPPWMASEAGMIPKIYQIVPDIMDHMAPGAYQTGENTAGTNPVAAMPSLHAAIPWLMAIALWPHRRVRWVGVWYAASMSFAVVYLGEHYFVDALAGFATAGIAWVAARRALAWWDGETAHRGARTALAAAPLVKAPEGGSVAMGSALSDCSENAK